MAAGLGGRKPDACWPSYLIPDNLRETEALPMPPGAAGRRLDSWADLSTPVLSEGSSEHQAKTGVYQQARLP